MSRAHLLPLLVAMLGACDEPSAVDGPSTPMAVTPATAAPTSSIRPPGDLYDDADVPVAPDFEEEAATAITKANHLEELQALEEALGAAPATSASGNAPPAAPSAAR